MKIAFTGNTVESHDIKPSRSFGVANMGFILHLLRKKIYSDIRAAVCREVMANARDAHREVGTPNKPIEVTLPNSFDPNYRVRDFGPGISPDRMENVFLLYGASTKREDNVQQGSWGVGAKSPLGYTDTFTINTVTGGVLRSYLAFVGPDNCGSLDLLDEQITDAPNGTEIVVPVKPQDFDYFGRATINSCAWWDVRPIITGQIVSFPDVSADNAVFAGTEWQVSRNASGNRECKLIVDGIEYPFDLNELPTNNGESFLFGAGFTLVLRFGIGVLSLAASREAVETDEPTLKAIGEAMERVKSEIATKIREKIVGAESFIAANIAFADITRCMNVKPRDITWNGMELFGAAMRIEVDNAIYVRGHKNARREYSGYQVKLLKNTLFLFNDLGKDLTESYVNNVFAACPPEVESVQILRLPESAAYKNKLVELLNPGVMSTYVKPRKQTARATMARLMFFRFDCSTNTFGRTSIADYEKDTNTKVCLTLVKTGTVRKPKGSLSNSNIASIHDAYPNVSFYGFMEDVDHKRVAEAVEGLVTLEDYAKTEVEKCDYAPEQIAYISAMRRGNYLSPLHYEAKSEEFVKNMDGILNPASPMSAYLTEVKYVLDNYPKVERVIALMSALGQRVDTGMYNQYRADKVPCVLRDLHAKVMERYTLIKYLETYNVNISDVFEYINLVDSAKGC